MLRTPFSRRSDQNTTTTRAYRANDPPDHGIGNLINATAWSLVVHLRHQATRLDDRSGSHTPTDRLVASVAEAAHLQEMSTG